MPCALALCCMLRQVHTLHDVDSSLAFTSIELFFQSKPYKALPSTGPCIIDFLLHKQSPHDLSMTAKLATNLRTETGGFCIKSLPAPNQALYYTGRPTCSQKVPLQRRQNYGDFTDRNFWPDLVWDGSRQRLINAPVGEHEGTPENKRTMRFFLHRSENAAGPHFDKPSTSQVLHKLGCSRVHRHALRPKSWLGSTTKYLMACGRNGCKTTTHSGC